MGTFTITDDDSPMGPVAGITWVGEDIASTKIGIIKNDNFTGLGGADIPTGNGGMGHDYIDASTGLDKVYGGDGYDTVFVGVGVGGADQIYGGLGYNALTLDRSSATTHLIVVFPPGGMSTMSHGKRLYGFEWFTLSTGSRNDTVSMVPIATS